MRDKCDRAAGNSEQKKEKKEKDKKDKKDKKGKEKKSSESTMLSTLLRGKKGVEYAMMAGVVEVERDDIVLATHSVDELAYLVEDAGMRGILDSGCSKSVVGINWLEKYNETLPKEIARSLRVEERRRVY